MTEKLHKKRIVIYTLVFIGFAMLIVFLSRKNNNETVPKDYSANDVVVPVINEAIGGSVKSVQGDVVGKTSVPNFVNQDININEKIEVDNSGEILEVEKKVIKTGNINMRVNSVEQTIDEIKKVAISKGGDEVSSEISKNDVYKFGFIVVKVSVDQYDKAFEEIKKIAPLVISESSQSQDVTAQFIDLETRIKNKREHEKKLREFFQKADEVSELIQVEKELARVRTEIEQMEGELKYLKKQTQYSTIHVTLREDSNIVVSDSWRPVQVIKDSINILIKKATNLLNIIIRFTITSLPFIIIFAIGTWFLYFTAVHIFGKKE